MLTDLDHVQKRVKELDKVIVERCGTSEEAVLLGTMPGVSHFTATALAEIESCFIQWLALDPCPELELFQRLNMKDVSGRP